MIIEILTSIYRADGSGRKVVVILRKNFKQN